MKKMIFLTLLFVGANYLHANTFTVNNKTMYNVRITGVYTSPVCMKDSWEIGPKSSTGVVNIGACMLHKISAISMDRLNLKSGFVDNIARVAPTDLVIDIVDAIGDQLTFQLKDKNGNLLRK